MKKQCSVSGLDVRKSGRTAMILFLVMTAACSSNPPELIRVKFQRNVFFDQELNATYERLSLFVQVDDKDGVDDIAEMKVTLTEKELIWVFGSDTWQIKNNDSETWIGSNSIVMPDFSEFPPGTYTVTITDLAGYTRENSFSVSASNIDPVTEKFPTIRFQSDSAVISSQEPVMIFFYSPTDKFMLQKQFQPGLSKKNLFTQPGQNGAVPATVYLYRFNVTGNYGILSGPFKIP